jgi:hypothetical protein
LLKDITEDTTALMCGTQPDNFFMQFLRHMLALPSMTPTAEILSTFAPVRLVYPEYGEAAPREESVVFPDSFNSVLERWAQRLKCRPGGIKLVCV